MIEIRIVKDGRGFQAEFGENEAERAAAIKVLSGFAKAVEMTGAHFDAGAAAKLFIDNILKAGRHRIGKVGGWEWKEAE